jgi:hypothetical protein
MTPVTMCTTLRMTMDVSIASTVPPLRSAASLRRIRSSRGKDAIGPRGNRCLFLENVADHAGARWGAWQVITLRT